jgi:Zn/Cd-binding protein ZinT
MVMKVINDSVGPDDIIFILLIFGAYPRINNNSLLSLMITKRTKTIRKTSNKIRKYYIKQYIENILRIKNSPDIIVIP